MTQRTATQANSRKRRAAVTRKDPTVQDFLDRFSRSLTAGDGRAVASMWETPAFVLGDRHARSIGSAQEIEQFFSGAKEHYNAQGISDTRAEIVKLDWVTDRIAIVEVRWPYLDQHGREAGEETSTYILTRDNTSNLRLRIAVMHGVRTSH